MFNIFRSLSQRLFFYHLYFISTASWRQSAGEEREWGGEQELSNKLSKLGIKRRLTPFARAYFINFLLSLTSELKRVAN